jgi:hypothetical protein
MYRHRERHEEAAEALAGLSQVHGLHAAAVRYRNEVDPPQLEG